MKPIRTLQKLLQGALQEGRGDNGTGGRSMDQHLSDRLIAAFPQLYRRWQGRDMQEVWRTRQDFECGNGWFELLWQLSAQLEAVLAALPEMERDAYAPTNVKEKVGELRFYLTRYTPEMVREIRSAEEQSIRTCEECGKPGARQEMGGVIRTRCTEHTPPGSVP